VPSRMRKLLLVVFAALALPGYAAAGPCGLPDSKPLWVDFGTPDMTQIFGRPGTVLAVSSGDFPAQMRAAGAKTMYWDMNLNKRVGTPSAPADPATITDKANRLFDFAAQQTACDKPLIVLNELFGAHLETPWTATNVRYRDNVLTLMRVLASRGARPFLLISKSPYTASEEAAAWWREAASYGDLVAEVYPNARLLHQQGAIVANRRLRQAYRRAVAQFVAIGIPVSRLGLILGFQSAPGAGGREGLRPREAWFEVVKWQTLSARRVAGEMKVPTIMSWGWGTFSAAGQDPDKPAAACVWLWTRNPSLCDGPGAAGPGFSASLTDGQLILPDGAMCTFGRGSIRSSAIARLNVMVGNRDVAYGALLARLAESQRASVTTREVLAAERAVVALRFSGSRSAYLSALARARASLDVARGVLADELRRQKIAAGSRVSRPPAAAINAFYEAYPELIVRSVEVVLEEEKEKEKEKEKKRAQKQNRPWWLGGRSSGLAISSIAPEQVFNAASGRQTLVRTLAGSYPVRILDDPRPLGSVPIAQARPAIAAALTQYARRDAVTRWSASQQALLLRSALCRRDDLPVPGTIDLAQFLPFLALAG
jgi:hypothetical protein